jgi:Actinobacteria/chloroflexi VLRF1 release factor
MPARPAAGGGRWVEVDPARLTRWLAGFAERHGEAASTLEGPVVRLTAADGSVAELHSPPGAPLPSSPEVDTLVAEALTPRRLGLLLARQSAVAIGIAEGPRLIASKVDSSYVQGRTAAGGWSQHRFARRRENQAKAAAGGAAEIAVRLLLPKAGSLVSVVTGGDRRAVDAVLSDPRLTPLADLRSERFLDVPEPRLAVLERAVSAARAVRIRVQDPPPRSTEHGEVR